MDESFWDKIADSYDDEIFDALGNDKNGVILEQIEKYSSKGSIASDFGCGIGKYLPILGERFKTVYAVDISQKSLEIAQQIHESLDNIIYIKKDLASPISIPKASFAVCINVLTMTSLCKRMNALKNAYRNMAKGGHLLIVVPSLESTLYSNFRLLEWDLQTNSMHNGVSATSLKPVRAREFSVPEGIINWGGALTKHYLKEEITVLLKKVGFNVLSIDKVEYAWTIEFTRPPKWMKEPYPWDWILLCQKTCVRL